MKTIFSLVIFLIFTTFETVAEEVDTKKDYHTFVLVHGATGGGWDWKEVGKYLSAKGHTVYRPTLTGLGERHHLSSPDINLTTHINDIVNLIIFEKLKNVVLVGHSYGGMVITGVIDRIPERIHHVTFLDAKVPEDGMSMMEGQPISAEHKVVNGQVHFSWIDVNSEFPRDVTQPLKTLTEPVSYKNPLAKKLNVTYVAFIPEGVSQADRAKDPSWHRAVERKWTIRTFNGDHVIYRAKPKEFSEMLEETVNDTNNI
ncbi:alpha/beta fold hydrolase [Microbulbifer sp. TRSA002]|uniref:alpha/beta fold hydrolase n=1 Tax=Microbulbifer sp. TRSA002 TaxID=3243382 RepID=UPI0040392434